MCTAFRITPLSSPIHRSVAPPDQTTYAPEAPELQVRAKCELGLIIRLIDNPPQKVLVPSKLCPATYLGH